MFSDRRWTLCWILPSLAVFSVAVASAQSGNADITGVVKDPSGAPVANATLSLTNQDSGVARSVVADADGRYRFSAILPGRYSLKTEATGFRPETITDIVLNIGAHLD